MSTELKIKAWKSITHVIAPCGDRWTVDIGDSATFVGKVCVALDHVADCDLCKNRATEEPDYEAYDRPARAYGWEVGRGRPLTMHLDSSPDNPFLDPDWRDNVVTGG